MSNENQKHEAGSPESHNPMEVARGQLLVQIDQWIKKKRRDPKLILVQFCTPSEFFSLGNVDGKPTMWVEFAACIYHRPQDSEVATNGRGLSQSKKLATFYTVLQVGILQSVKGESEELPEPQIIASPTAQEIAAVSR